MLCIKSLSLTRNPLEEPRETTKTFPNDLDTTSTALRVLPHKDSHINFMLDKMLKYVTAEGLVQVREKHSFAAGIAIPTK